MATPSGFEAAGRAQRLLRGARQQVEQLRGQLGLARTGG
jgi:hypothetical protein